MGDIPKEALLYIHRKNTDYQCSDCTMFKPGAQGCSIHKESEKIRGIGSCGFFFQGKPAGKGAGYLTLIESGYEESPQGFSCKRCLYFDGLNDCVIADASSEGDDPGRIHPDACCNAWEPGE